MGGWQGGSSVTGETPGSGEGALASQGAPGGQRVVVGKRTGQLAGCQPPCSTCALHTCSRRQSSEDSPRKTVLGRQTSEDSPRLHRNSWLPHLGGGNIDGNLSMLALKEKQQSLSPGVSRKVTSTLSVPCLARWSSAGWPHPKSLAIQILAQEILPSEDRCEGARKLGSGGNSSLGS